MAQKTRNKQKRPPTFGDFDRREFSLRDLELVSIGKRDAEAAMLSYQMYLYELTDVMQDALNRCLISGKLSTELEATAAEALGMYEQYQQDTHNNLEMDLSS